MHRAIRAGLVFFASAILVPIGTAGTVLGAFLFLPLPATLPKPKPNVASSMSHVYDINGNEIAVFRQYETSIPVQQKDIPEVLKQAVVSIEDKRFYSHGGVDPQGTLRAMWADIRGQAIQGGSTITQQYVKNAYTGRTRSVARKIREAILASQLDRQAPKDEILYRYLSTIYLGGGAYGVGAATQTYFRKPITQLSLAEAALLAGVIRAPSYYDPRLNPDGAETRRELVLQQMVNQKRITPDQFNQAVAAKIYVAGGATPPPKGPHTDIYPPEQQQTQFPYFVDYVSKYLVAKYGHDKVYRGGLRIQTSLDPNLQSLAEGAVAGALKGTKAPREMSLVTVEPQTGFVKALVGGRDFGASQVNLALGACPPPAKPEQSGADTPVVPSDQPICVPGGGGGRQPGSSFKPFTLAKAFEEGITPERVFSAPNAYTYPKCVATAGSSCTVHNVEGEGGGAMTLRSATVHSVNTVFAQLIGVVGVKPTAELAHRLGITRVNPDATDAVTGRQFQSSLTLGSPDVAPVDMAAAYSVFAARGLQNPATPIVKIEDSTGAVLEDNTKREPKRVMQEVIADNVTNVLQGVIAGGTGTGANINRPAAGKTGTTDNFGNAWFVGYTPTLSTAVWYGNSDGEVSDPLPHGTYGGTTPARTWANFMSEALKDVPVTDFNQPAPLKPVADELDRQARGGFDAGYRRLPDQTGAGGKYEQGFPPPRVAAPVTTAPTTTTTIAPSPVESTTTTTTRRGVFG
ncbi:MAG TPA: transglycosylase domain-containing protein [Acidimicrobiales bacterium]|jgi:penicillin-binding protein 1A|nr:transglycosylase domain-containing protein [Acidimicrobiales bacterium]